MCDSRGAGVLATAFVAGVLCTAALTADGLRDPIPSPFFGLEEPPIPDSVAPAVERQVDEPQAIAVAAPRPPVGGFADMAAALARPPERLAVAPGHGPIAAAIQSQALPTAARGGSDPVAHAAPLVQSQPPLDSRAVAEPELHVLTEEQAPRPAADELKALVERVRPAPAEPPPRIAEPPGLRPAPPPKPAPLPGEEWIDPEQVNWSDAAADRGQPPASAARPFAGGRRRGIFGDRRPEGAGGVAEPAASPRPVKLLERLRGDRRSAPESGPFPGGAVADDPPPEVGRWPTPTRLLGQLEQVGNNVRLGQAGHAEIAAWTALCGERLQEVSATGGPADRRAAAPLLALGDVVAAGMSAGDAVADAGLASLTRRAALAVSRRVAVWRAAAALCEEIAGSSGPAAAVDVDRRLAASRLEAEIAVLLTALERFECHASPGDAAAAKAAAGVIATAPYATAADLTRALGDHYLAPNVRIAVHRRFVERMLPEATVKTSPMQDFVLGRAVRGTSTVEQSMGVAFVPDADRIRLEIHVRGEVASRTVTDAGPAAIHSRGEASFMVRKPLTVSAQGLAFGAALGSASNSSQLATIQTSFDSVPIMGPLVQRIVRNQHDESKPQATREVNEKIITRACHEVDAQSEPKFTAIAERIRARVWNPMVQLGLEPTPVALESTASAATVRLRLAAAEQLAAHTPRPRASAESLLSLQVHESTLNNGCQRLHVAGRRFALEDLIRFVSGRLGIEPRIPDELPEGVAVTFAAVEPLRLECRDGLVRIRLALDAIESGRRNWYDVVAEVAYQPTAAGPQILLERSGQVHLPGHKGLEIPLRTIFAKIFAKERPIALLPESVAKNPRLSDVRAVQVVSTDGWFAFALDGPAEGATAAAPRQRPAGPAAQGRVPRRR